MQYLGGPGSVVYALTGGAGRRVRHTGRQEPFRLLWRRRGQQNWQTLKGGFLTAEAAIKWLERKTEWKRPASTS